MDVSERLLHGSLDFAVMLEPIDNENYEFFSLPDDSEWGILTQSNDALATQPAVTKDMLVTIPLVMHRRTGLQNEIAHWAGVAPERLQIAATYNVVHGSPMSFVQQKLGYFLTTRDMLVPELDPDVCFLPLTPKLPTKLALVWKKHTVFRKAAETFYHVVQQTVVQTAMENRWIVDNAE